MVSQDPPPVEEPVPGAAVTSLLSAPLLRRLAQISDELIPEGDGMPSASEAGVAGPQLVLVMEARPDLLGPLRRALSVTHGGSAVELLAFLQASDPEGHEALVLTVLGGYYLAKQVTDRLGYPGQQPAPLHADIYPPYVDEGLLDRVVDRGPIYREASSG